MKKTVLLIVIAMMATMLFPTAAFAETDITVTGSWTCSYEVFDMGVGASGGTGTLRLFVENTDDPHSIHAIKYVSISYATGRDSEIHSVQSVHIAATRDAILDFTIPIAESDAGLGLQLWVAMSMGDADDVDGIGVVNGVKFGPDPVYDATCDISTRTTVIERGAGIMVSYGGANTGNKAVDVKLYDQFDNLVLHTEDMDILYLGKIEYYPTETTTYRFRAELYKPGTTTLVKTVESNAITITVTQPTPEPTETPVPETATPEPVDESTPEPDEEIVEPTPTPEPNQEVVAAEESDNETVVIVDENTDDGANLQSRVVNMDNLLMVVILGLLVIIAIALVGIVIYLAKSRNR